MMGYKGARYLFFFLLIGLISISMVHGEKESLNWAERFPSKQTPTLEQAMVQLASNATLDVYAVMKDRMSANDLKDRVRVVPLSDRHKVVSSVLRSYAETSQRQVRSFLSGRTGITANTPVRVLWLSNALGFTATAEDIHGVRGLPEVGYIGLIPDLPAEVYQDIDAGNDSHAIIYYNGFESGRFGPEWVMKATGSGRIRLTSDNGPIGNYHVTMDSSFDEVYGTVTLTLTLDLSSETNCYLSIYYKEFNDEWDPEDVVSISDGSGTFYPILEVRDSSYYKVNFFDLDYAASLNGISLTDDFKIRFKWKDDYPIPTDGFAFDEIKIVEGDIPDMENLEQLQATQCWDLGITGEGALILNIDSGVDYDHPDLENQIWSNPGEAPYGINDTDDDLNGYVDDFIGWDFVEGDNDPFPISGHGTSTGGIVCGDGTSGLKTGMAHDARMAVARILTPFEYWEAQQYAVLIGARAITSSYSFKWGDPPPDYHMFRSNCEMELTAGVIHANSIGNQGMDTVDYPIPCNISTPVNCPGPWTHPDQDEGGTASVMGCAGIYMNDSLYSSSGQGPSAWEDMTLYEPAYPYSQNSDYWDYPYGGFSGGLPGLLKPDVCTYTYVMTINMFGGYHYFGGTSAAAPHLGGAFCLLISGNAYASPRKISQALQETAVDLGDPGKDLRYGAGKIQVYDALLRILNNLEISNIEPALGETIDVEISGIPEADYALAWSFSPGSHTIPGIGTFDMGPPLHFPIRNTLPPSGIRVHEITIPSVPALAGKTIYVQTAMDDRDGNTGQILFSLLETIEVQP